MAFELRRQMLTKNDCYKAAQKMTPKGIVVHSTGANNPYLLRYVQPDDGKLGVNKYGNSWNREGVEVAVHAMIGKCYDDSVACYQLLPWNIACWGVGRGNKGSYNYDPTGHIQFEICEDALTDKTYFTQAFDTAIDFCVYLCQQYNLPVSSIVSHKECHALGYGSDHGDPENWLSKFGKDMNWFRSEVQKRMSASTGFKVNDVVYYAGGQTFKEKNDITASGLRTCGEVKIAAVDLNAKHQYKVLHTAPADGITGWTQVDGWVNAGQLFTITDANKLKCLENMVLMLRKDDEAVRKQLIAANAQLQQIADSDVDNEDIKQLKGEIAALKNATNSLNAMVAKYQTENKSLQDQLTSLNDRDQQNSQELQRYKDLVAAKDATIVGLNQSVATLQIAVDNSKEETNKLKNIKIALDILKEI